MDAATNTSMVRGQTIFFAPGIINPIYGLPNPDDDDLQRFLNRSNMEEIYQDQEMFPFGLEWHNDANGKRIWFQQRNLSMVAKVWLLVLSTRLEPNRNTNEIRPMRAAWLYAIMKQKPINVGRIICANMKKCRNKRYVRSLYFGSTITKLIAAYGNPPGADIGSVLPSNIGLSTLRALGPCVGPNGEAPVCITFDPPPVLNDFPTYFDRLEHKIDDVYADQKRIRDELALVHAIQAEHFSYIAYILYYFGTVLNNVEDALKMANVPTVPPFAFQNMNFNFPAGQDNFQPQVNHFFQGEGVAEIQPQPHVYEQYAAEPELDNPGYPVDGNVDMDFELFRGMVIGESSNSAMEESRDLYQKVGGDSY
ncbi:hypothetical protein A4A49_04169 [Nicotiana attenuata]|uniref:Putative plant transposon protein domain-containing protein n=1 Tax=Nicotiana attenuata TaxID=49451 RepID=A0A1J6IHU8_NICAT|nr:hypothetical protein A4A49_04169 [Nicotiana attenuata]